MKRVKRSRLLAILLTVAMTFSVCGVTAFAETNYGIQINHGTTNTHVTSNNASDILGDGTVSYDADTNTLTLNNADLTYERTGNAVIYVPNNKGLNINLSGTNKMTAAQCIFVTGDLTITGSGSLEATGTATTVSATGNLTIDGSAVTASSDGTSSAAVHSQQGAVTIENNARVEATAAGAWGIYANKDISITDSTVIGSSTGVSNSAGINAVGDVTIVNSDVTATSKENAGVAGNGITITNSTVEAASTSGYFAIGAQGDLNISGGTVTATADGLEANAIFVNGTLSISEKADVTAKATNNGSYPALYGENGVSISASKVMAESGGDAGIFSPASVSITSGSAVTATGYWQGVRGNGDGGVTISDSTVDAVSKNDVAIYSPNDVTIVNSVVDATGIEDNNGILSDSTASVTGSWIHTSGSETFAGHITDSVLINGTTGNVIGNVELPGNVTIPAGTTLTVPSGASLTVPEHVTLTNDGTVNVKGSIVNNGQVICSKHTGGTATCTEKATCSVCGQKYGDLVAHRLVKTEAKQATCTEAGYEAYWTCDECDKLFSDEAGTQEIEAPTEIAIRDHTWGDSWKSDANSHWQECTVCNERTNATAHTFQWIIDREATATDKGSKHEECSVCHYKKEADQNIPQTGETGNSTLWVALLLTSAGVLTGAVLVTRKRKQSKS